MNNVNNQLKLNKQLKAAIVLTKKREYFLKKSPVYCFLADKQS